MCVLWDISTGQQITALKDHEGEVDTIAVLADNNTFLSGDDSITIVLF